MTNNETTPPADPTGPTAPHALDTTAPPATPHGVTAVEAVRTQPVRGTSPRSRRGSPARWAIASIVTALVLVTSAAGFTILAAGAATSTLVGYVPAGSVGYMEIRLDAPGDQRQNAANLLSHFPGFADQSTLSTKLNEALDQLVGQASGHTQTFTGNVRSWLGDSLAVVMTRLPDRAAASAATTHQKAGIVLVSVKDPVGARAWATLTFGTGTASETYAGIPLTSVEKHGMTLQYGVVSNVLLIGDATSVHNAIDSGGSSAFADSASFKAAAAAVPGDRLAFGFLDLRAITDAVAAARPAAAPSMAIALDQVPAWIAVSVRAESDSLSATVALPQTNLAPVTANHASGLATKLPPGTVMAGEVHDLAAIFGTVTTALGNASGGQTSTDQINQALKAVGGIDALVGWMGDATVAVVRTDDKAGLAGGLVIQAKDADTAATKLLQIRNLVSLVGGASGIASTNETYNGATITLIDAGELSRYTAGRGALPGQVAGAHLQIAIAQKDDLVVAGIGDAFVKAVLDTKAGASLADQDAYRNAMERAGAANTGQLYIDLRTALDLATSSLLPAAAYQRYESDIQPYLNPFRAFAASGSAGDPNRARFVITVK